MTYNQNKLMQILDTLKPNDGILASLIGKKIIH